MNTVSLLLTLNTNLSAGKITLPYPEAFLQPCQTSTMESFGKHHSRHLPAES